jgi:hypothetical protein
MLNSLANGKSTTPVSGGPLPRRCAEHLLALTDAELARVDPVEMNLLVAQGIPSLADLDIHRYQRTADAWAEDIRQRLPAAEVAFHQTPQDWKNDLRFFRLGMVCWYVDQVLGIRYREDQRELKRVLYTDPSDLFLNGVMDTRRGTCGNMASLHVAIGWRLGWTVSLACVGSHFICRYDDGEVTHNIEATKNGGGGFHSHPDEYYLQEHRLPRKAVTCGSDLRAVSPREMLGLFFGLRARHFDNINRLEEAERDYLVARYLFPRNRQLYVAQNQASVQCSMELFEPGEKGHPTELACWLQDVVRLGPWNRDRFPQTIPERTHENSIEAFFIALGASRTV